MGLNVQAWLPHDEANLRGLIVEDKASASEAGGKGEKNAQGDNEKATDGGKSRAKKKVTDSEHNTSGTTNNKKLKTG